MEIKNPKITHSWKTWAKEKNRKRERKQVTQMNKELLNLGMVNSTSVKSSVIALFSGPVMEFLKPQD